MYTNKKKKKTKFLVCVFLRRSYKMIHFQSLLLTVFFLAVIVVKTRFCSCHISSKTLKNEKKITQRNLAELQKFEVLTTIAIVKRAAGCKRDLESYQKKESNFFSIFPLWMDCLLQKIVIYR